MSLTTGEVVQGKYRIVRLIGEGGMGAVYEGENIAIGRRVAIKVLHGAVATSADAVARFEQEARAAGRIGNDHILEVLDLGTLDDGDRYMVLEYLDGETLSGRIKRLGRIAPRDLVDVARQILDGLAAVHASGITHRDLKPENIFILTKKAGRTDFVKIIDFGISKFNTLTPDGMRMTATGAVMGTPYYMSPEQARGAGQADHRSDLYAVGVILYEAVTGRVPYDGVTFNDLIFKIVLADFTPIREIVPDVDPAFDSIIAKAMAKDPDQRFQTAEAFENALARWEKDGTSVSIPPPTTAEQLAKNAGVAPAAAAALSATPNPAGPAPQAGLSGTAGNWSQTGPTPGAAPPSSQKTIVVATAVMGGLVAAAAVAFFVMRGSASSAAPAASAIPAAAAPSAAPAAPPTPAPEEAKPAPAPEPVVAPAAAAPSAEPAATEPVAKTATAKPTAKVAAAAPAPKTGSLSAYRSAAAAATPATKTPAPTTTKPKRDFGY